MRAMMRKSVSTSLIPTSQKTTVVSVVKCYRAWPDLLVDFGRELYVPWLIAEGGALYTDLAYFNGPLSPYANAAWFGLVGEGVLTLAAANLLVLAGITLLLLRLLGTAGNRFSAAVAVAYGLFVGMFIYRGLT